MACLVTGEKFTLLAWPSGLSGTPMGLACVHPHAFLGHPFVIFPILLAYPNPWKLMTSQTIQKEGLTMFKIWKNEGEFKCLKKGLLQSHHCSAAAAVCLLIPSTHMPLAPDCWLAILFSNKCKQAFSKGS